MGTILGPRVVIAGVASGVGKTTVATGLMAALRATGLNVASAKVGPDFIDPGYHSLATGKPGRNLDSWICGEDAIAPLAARAAAGSDVLIIEGVMGLFDGAADGVPEASTASIARLLDAPIILVIDVSALSGSVAAIVHGYSTIDPSISIAGVILNRVASAGHEALLREALVPLGTKVLGAVRRDDAFAWRDRHLGLVPVAEHPQEVGASITALSSHIAASVDLEAVLAAAASSVPMSCNEPCRARHVGSARIAIAAGPAFDFVYRDNLEALIDAGAELLSFDPRHDSALPTDVTALYAGGGFPEVFAADLALNGDLRDDLQRHYQDGLVIWAECGGLLWLTRSLDGHRMAGIVPADATMAGGFTLGYRKVELRTNCPLGQKGDQLRGHEFHYSSVTPAGDALHLSGRHGEGVAGFASEQLLASYVHLHLGGDPRPAESFVTAACARRR